MRGAITKSWPGRHYSDMLIFGKFRCRVSRRWSFTTCSYSHEPLFHRQLSQLCIGLAFGEDHPGMYTRIQRFRSWDCSIKASRSKPARRSLTMGQHQQRKLITYNDDNGDSGPGMTLQYLMICHVLTRLILTRNRKMKDTSRHSTGSAAW